MKKDCIAAVRDHAAALSALARLAEHGTIDEMRLLEGVLQIDEDAVRKLARSIRQIDSHPVLEGIA